MKNKRYQCTSTLWLYPGESANWHFLTVPKAISTEIKLDTEGLRRGFGSVPVEVTIGKNVWNTSLFPDSSAGTFLLPVKAKVRRDEDLYVDEKISVSFKIRKK
jgi:hypothetical protein